MSEHKVIATSRGTSVRYRLLAIALVPMLVILPLLLGVSIYRWNAKFDAMTMSKVNDDLTRISTWASFWKRSRASSPPRAIRRSSAN
jgi:hypothetical protein